MRRGFRLILTLAGVIALFLLLAGEVGLLLVPITLLAGWTQSAARFVRAWHSTTGSVVTVAVGVTVLLAGSHRFLQWLASGLAKGQRQDPKAMLWPMCGFGVAFCALLAMGAAMLTTHQLYWLSKSRAPWSVTATRRLEPVMIAARLRQEAEAVQWDNAATRAAFWRMLCSDDQPAGELVEPLWLEKDQRKLRAIILIPRDKAFGERTLFAVIEPDQREQLARKIEKLPQVLASYGVRSDMAEKPRQVGP